MKYSHIFFAVFAAASTLLAGCTKEASIPEKANSDNFSIIAGTEESKTTNDNLSTAWESDDALTVFHAEAGAATYSSNDQFTLADAESKTFSGALTEALEEGKSYDWYVIYPYNIKYTSPVNNTSCWQYIGSKSVSTAQAQTGLGSKAHLAGSYFPLYGKASSIAYDATPEITMKQAAAVIKIHVLNNSGDALIITSASVTAQNDYIAGSFLPVFSGEDLKLADNTSADYMSKTASLSVIGAAALANTESADLYIAVRPFTASAGSTLDITVNGNKKTLTFGSETSFPAGTIKKISFNFKESQEKIANGDYIIMAKDEVNNYYAISSSANGSTNRRDRAAITDYDPGVTTYVAGDESIIWTVAQKNGGYTIHNDTGWMKYSKNLIPLDSSEDNATVFSGAKNDDGTWSLMADAYYIALNGTSGFGCYASATGTHNLYLIPATLGGTWHMAEIADLEYNDNETHETAVTTTATSVSAVAYNSDAYSAIADWITVSFDGSVFKYKAETNNTGLDRTAYVIVTATNANGSNTHTFTISQKNANSDKSVTYSVSAKNAVTITGTAPDGSSAIYTQTYSTTSMITKDNSSTLTLSGYAGKTITGIVLSMKSNTSKGAGTFSAVAGTTTIAAISSATTFNNWYNNTSYGTTYRDVTVTMDNDSYTIGTDEKVVIKIEGTTNSLYIQSYKISYK